MFFLHFEWTPFFSVVFFTVFILDFGSSILEYNEDFFSFLKSQVIVLVLTEMFKMKEKDHNPQRRFKIDNSEDVWWYEPKEETLPFEFCRDTSLHGLKYILQPQRHLSERSNEIL